VRAARARRRAPVKRVPESRILSAFLHQLKIFARKGAQQKVFSMLALRSSRRARRALAGGGTYTQN
jgi:hypothetical protein